MKWKILTGGKKNYDYIFILFLEIISKKYEIMYNECLISLKYAWKYAWNYFFKYNHNISSLPGSGWNTILIAQFSLKIINVLDTLSKTLGKYETQWEWKNAFLAITSIHYYV